MLVCVMRVRACVRAGVRACVRVCVFTCLSVRVRACAPCARACVCVHACVHAFTYVYIWPQNELLQRQQLLEDNSSITPIKSIKHEKANRTVQENMK